jgi:branched-chain amino acid aminotransferase
LRYGDGLFETIRVKDDRIVLADLHFQRLLSGARLLQFEPFPLLSPEKLSGEILALCRKNGHAGLARVRLAIYRGEIGQEDAFPNYIIQSWPLEPAGDELNVPGLALGVFREGCKACDVFANLKSNNYLIYSMAAMHARRHGWDDCLVLNSLGRVADSSIANLFYVKGGVIYTPPLSEGCVAGVMRRWLIGFLPGAGFRVEEKPVAPEDLLLADEVFLSNAIRGVRWVSRFGGMTFGSKVVEAIKKMEYEGLR